MVRPGDWLRLSSGRGREGSDRAGYGTKSRPDWPGVLSWWPSWIFRSSGNRGL